MTEDKEGKEVTENNNPVGGGRGRRQSTRSSAATTIQGIKATSLQEKMVQDKRSLMKSKANRN